MHNYTTKNEKVDKNEQDLSNLSTLLVISGSGDLLELLENNLPQPHEYDRSNGGWTIKYILTGVFFTKSSVEYLNDILARFALTLNVTSVTTQVIKKQKNSLDLKYFQNLKSIRKNIFHANANKHDDAVFWSIKLYVESLLQESNFVAYDVIESYAFSHFIDHVKDKSTLRAKCRSIWNYYNDRDFQTSVRKQKLNETQRKEYEMKRSENMRKQALARADETKRKVINVITGMFAHEYKKKNGEWNISKIAKEINVSRNSVYKYIQAYEQAGL